MRPQETSGGAPLPGATLAAPFFDIDVPAHVKRAYSPRPAWRERPFGPLDERFFLRGVQDLSALFAPEREGAHGARRLPRGYLNHPRMRSAYLLYFLPLQTAKFLHLFSSCPAALDAALAHGRSVGALRVADLGCGPGTASIALLLALAARRAAGGAALPPVDLCWYDTHTAITADGEALIERLRQRLSLPAVTLNVKHEPWARAADAAPDGGWSLTLLGHVLNEGLSGDRVPAESDVALWRRLLAQNRGGGVLVVEPAVKTVAQYLGRLRDALLAGERAGGAPTPLHGPCLHVGPCPLAHGRDWCHTSVPCAVPSRLYRSMSERMGSSRAWLKFSWLWLASAAYPAPAPAPDARRVLSDRLGRGSGPVLLCEPGRPVRYERTGGSPLRRGDILRLAHHRSRTTDH